MLSHLKSLTHLQKLYPTQDACIAFLELVLWNNVPVSPFDNGSKVYRCKDGKYRCKNSGKYFNVLKGTMFEHTRLELSDWFYAIWKMTTSGSGMTAVDLQTDLGVSYNTAWLLFHKIRANCQIENQHILSGIVETDETFVGGKNKNRHKMKKVNYKAIKKENPDKTVVLGMKERGGKMVMRVVRDRSMESLQPMVQKYVSNGANLITDELSSYSGLSVIYKHTSINHSAYEYVNRENAALNNNGIEGEWRLLKRSVSGTYCHVKDEHLQSYVDESVFRKNLRGLTASDKFHWLIANCSIVTTENDLRSRIFLDGDDTSTYKTYKGTSNKRRQLDKPNFNKLK